MPVSKMFHRFKRSCPKNMQLSKKFRRRNPLNLLPYITKTRPFKYTYIYMKILPPKNENFQIKSSDSFHISAQNIDCGYSLEPPRRGGSNEYPQSMFWAEIIKNNVYPCKPQFYYIKVGFMGVKIIQACFRDVYDHGSYLRCRFAICFTNTNQRLLHMQF